MAQRTNLMPCQPDKIQNEISTITLVNERVRNSIGYLVNDARLDYETFDFGSKYSMA